MFQSGTNWSYWTLTAALRICESSRALTSNICLAESDCTGKSKECLHEISVKRPSAGPPRRAAGRPAVHAVSSNKSVLPQLPCLFACRVRVASHEACETQIQAPPYPPGGVTAAGSLLLRGVQLVSACWLLGRRVSMQALSASRPGLADGPFGVLARAGCVALSCCELQPPVHAAKPGRAAPRARTSQFCPPGGIRPQSPRTPFPCSAHLSHVC